MRKWHRSAVEVAGRSALAAVALAIWTIDQASATDTPSSDIAGSIQRIVVEAHAPDVDLKSLNLADLRAFYGRRKFELVWTDSRSTIAISALESSDQDGLDPFDYHAATPLLRAAPVTAIEKAERDILLTDGVLRLARDLRTGRATLRAIDSDVELPSVAFDAPKELDAALESSHLDSFLAGLAPSGQEYLQLRTALARYRGIAANGGWKSLALNTAVDLDGASARALRERLSFEDDNAADPDASVVEMLKRFQLRHGLDDDGRLGPRTLAALNVSASDRVMQIIANMERWRWLPPHLEQVRLAVNVPDGRLDFIAGGASTLSSVVIVGKPSSPTPILRASAKAVTINPPWNVPAKIANREILAKLRQSADYLQAQNMILVDGPPGDPFGHTIDWKHLDSFPYHVRQLPGPKNALGQIKLELPNRFDVYLHDTPAKAAFDLDNRHLSHGCVRVQQILPLASYALAGDATTLVAELKTAISTGTTQHLALAHPLPIYLLYWTVFTDSTGALQFRPDVYHRDARLIAALDKHANGQSVTRTEGQCRRA